jgi:hypothetical protein
VYSTRHTHPLLERGKFHAIVGSNLDEFFMVRVATLLKKQRAGADDVSPDGSSVGQQIAAIRPRSARMMQDHAACWQRTLGPALAEHGITVIEPADYSDELRAWLPPILPRCGRLPERVARGPYAFAVLEDVVRDKLGSWHALAPHGRSGNVAARLDIVVENFEIAGRRRHPQRR